MLLLLAVAYTLVAVAFWSAAAWLDRAESIESAKAYASTLARLSEQHASRIVGSSHPLLEAMVYEVAAGGLFPAFSRRKWAEIRAVSEASWGVTAAWVLSPDGMLLLSSREYDAPPEDLSGRDFVRAHPRPGYFIGSPFSGPGGQRYLTISRTVLGAENEFLAIAVAVIDAREVAEFFRSLGMAADSAVGLFRLDGTLLVREPAVEPGEPLAATAPLFEIIDRSPAGTYLARTPDDDAESIVAYRKVGDLPLVAVASLAKADALASWRQRLFLGLGLGIMALLAFTALAYVGHGAMRREETIRQQLEGANRLLEDRTTALETALGEKDLLFREIHHRVKNNLQVVHSLLTMQSLRFPQPELRDAFQETFDRIRAMGLVHELLYRQDQADRVDFAAYLETLCRSLASSHGTAERGIEIAVEATPGQLGLNTAIPAALIVNELVTNALKHAFPGDRPGRIVVRFQSRDRGWRLIVSDNGVGIPEGLAPRRRAGIGLTLVDTLAGQLGGRVMKRIGDGASFEISFG